LKGENARGSDEAMEQYAAHLRRINQLSEEARTKIDAPAWEPDETSAAILRYFKNTTYRTKDRDTPE